MTGADGSIVKFDGKTLESDPARRLARPDLMSWRYRSWMHRRDPKFIQKTGVIVDLYAGLWEGNRLGRRNQVISADEKTSTRPGRIAR
jgi:hypothetical protein